MFIFFLSSLINVAMTHMWLMDVINLIFLFGGTFFWWPMVGIDPIIHWKIGYGARMFFVLVGSAIDAFLGVAILNLSHPIASMYSLSSTHGGGGLIWAGTDVLALVAFGPIYLQWMRSEERAGRRSDRQLAKPNEMSAHSNGRSMSGLTSQSTSTHKMSAWEAAWQQHGAGTPPVSERENVRLTHDGDPVGPLPATNGNGHEAEWSPVPGSVIPVDQLIRASTHPRRHR